MTDTIPIILSPPTLAQQSTLRLTLNSVSLVIALTHSVSPLNLAEVWGVKEKNQYERNCTEGHQSKTIVDFLFVFHPSYPQCEFIHDLSSKHGPLGVLI